MHLPAKQIAPAAGRLRHGFRAAYHHKNRPRKLSPRQWIKPQHNAAGHKTNGSPHSGNSAQRVRALHDAFAVPADLADALAALDGPVLLVDDLVDSGWTMSMVARLLRRAGAPDVLPLALAVAG